MNHDVVILGAGPGGYVAAIRAAQLGLSVGCVEKEKTLGGTCVRIGCIPSKALLESSDLYHEAKDGFARHGVLFESVRADLAAMQKRKDEVVKSNTSGVDYLFKKNKVARYLGHGRLAGPGKVVVEGAEKLEIAAKNVILATGSISTPLKGVEVDGDVVGTSTEALSWPAVPKHLVVIGAGAIGLEMGSVWLRLGAKVTVLEYADRILPGMDAEISAEAQKIFKKQGFMFQLGARVTGARKKGSGAVVTVDGKPDIECDRVRG